MASPTDLDFDHQALWLELAESRRSRGDLAGAEEALDRADATEGPTHQSRHLRALVALAGGRAAAAEAWFAESAQLAGDAPSQARGLANAGAAALEAGGVARAQDWLERAQGVRARHGLGSDAGLSLNLARVAMLKGALDDALALFDQVRAGGEPRLVALALLFEGELRLAAGMPGAEECLRRAVADALAPQEAARGWLALAEVAAKRGHNADAVHALRRALEGLVRPEDRVGPLAALGGHLYVARDVAGAQKVLDEAQAMVAGRTVPDSLAAQLATNRGLVQLAQGELDSARVLLEEATRLYGALGNDRARATQLRALVDLQRYQGNLDAAIALQGELATLEPEFVEPLPEGGMLYSAVEDRSLSVSVGALRRAGPEDGQGPVLFVVPPAWGASGPLFPRGAVSVASYLEAHGIPARVLPLAEVVDSSDDAATAARRTRDALARAIEAYRPRAIGLSVPFSYLYPQGQQVAAWVRALAPDCPVVIGGPHVTYLDRETLRETPAIDVVVRGEGEWTALDLFAALRAGADLADVPGITWRAPDGSVVRNKGRKLGDVRSLPPVDFNLLPSTFAHRMDVSALTSRGCAFRCKFCHEFRYWGGVVRDFPVARIIGEMERLARFGNHLQGIDDSMLDMTTPLFMELVDALGKSHHVTPNFGLLTRLDTVTAEGSRAMRRAGLRWVSMGAESGSQVVLDAMNKGLAVERTVESLRLVREAGLEAATFFIVGHPGDSVEESAVTRSFVERLWRDDLVSWIDVSTFSPYPGTPFYGMAHRYGVRILTRDWSRWRRSNRPVAELETYPAAAIYRGYLELLAVQARHRDAASLVPPGPQATGQ